MGSKVGGDHVGVPSVWPASLRLPRRPLRVIYLDQGHWVALAKALAGVHRRRTHLHSHAVTCGSGSRVGRPGGNLWARRQSSWVRRQLPPACRTISPAKPYWVWAKSTLSEGVLREPCGSTG